MSETSHIPTSTHESHDDAVRMRSRVMESIAEQGITPKPRWHFLLREWVIWTIAAFAFVVGSIASALSIYITDASRFMENTIELSSMDVVFEVVPFVWLILFGLAVFYAVHACHETKHGYRLSTAWLVLIAVVASVGGGSILYAQGFGAAIDRYLLATTPLYPSVSGYRPHHFMRPQQGIIAGMVVDMDGDADDQMIQVRTLDGDEWKVVRSTSTVEACPNGQVKVGQGMRVRITGTTTGEGMYQAYAICAFRGRGDPPPLPRHVQTTIIVP